MIDVSLFLVILIYLLIYLIYLLVLICPLGDSLSNTLNVKDILKIYLIEQKIYPNQQAEWVICLSQWFITLCLWLYCISITKMSDLSRYVSDYCISITKMSDMSITVIYHTTSLTVLYLLIRWWHLFSTTPRYWIQ